MIQQLGGKPATIPTRSMFLKLVSYRNITFLMTVRIIGLVKLMRPVFDIQNKYLASKKRLKSGHFNPFVQKTYKLIVSDEYNEINMKCLEESEILCFWKNYTLKK